jgi:hypothetical protein
VAVFRACYFGFVGNFVMNDFDQFERRLAAALRSDADQGTARFDAAAVARAAIASARGSAVHMPRRFSTPTMFARLAAAAVVGALVVVGAFFLGQRVQPAVVGGPSQTPGASASPSEPASPSAGPSSTVVPAPVPSWTATGSMGMARGGFSATLLPDGKVLAAGGDAMVEGVDTASAELYDPATGTWSATGSMATARAGHSATLLPDGKVLVAGGGRQSDAYTWLASAELYDPATGIWTTTGSLATSRVGHTATLLPDGKVLVVGGETDSAAFPGNPVGVASAELYDPATGSWAPAATMPSQRFGHTATLLPAGKVLVAGGACCGASPEPLASAELYDPATDTWIATGSMSTQRVGHTATRLIDGRVLVTSGGQAELYDPGTGAWTPTGTMVAPYGACSATLLLDDKVLVAGGIDRHLNAGDGAPVAAAELYDPATGTWSATASMVTPRCGTATRLIDGRVLVAGGDAPKGPSGLGTSAELYDPGTGR